MIVNVYPAKDCPEFFKKIGYVAISQEIICCWSHAETIDATIEKFKKEFSPILNPNEKFEFRRNICNEQLC